MKHWFYVPGGEVGGVMVLGSWQEIEVDHSGHSPGLVRLWEEYDRTAAGLVAARRRFLLFPPQEEDVTYLAHHGKWRR